MNFATTLSINMNKLFTTALLISFLIIAGKTSTVFASPTQTSLVSTAQMMMTSSSAKLWEGSPKGHVPQGNATTNEVLFLIYLGRVHAAIGRANSYDKEPGMTNPLTARVLSDYMTIDPIVSGKSSKNLTLQPLLSEIAAPESFALLASNTREQRKARNALTVKVRDLIARVDWIITERFPSTRSSALAMSALYRKAGELLMTALSNEGHILDISKYRDALQLMEASLRLQVKKVSQCERSRNAINQLKSRGPLGDLLDKVIVVTESGTVNANAGDVFEAAGRLQELGTSLPTDDKLICQ